MSSPLYSRIEGALRAQISSGRLRPGDCLPSETDIAQTFGTTRMTVRQALARLRSDGLIVSRVGRGSFVTERRVEGRLLAQRPQSFEEQVEAGGARVTFRVIGFECEPASKAVAEGLEIEEGELVYRLRRLRLVSGEVISLEDRYLRAQLGASVAAIALTSQSAVKIVETALGEPLGGMKVAVGAVMPPPETARLLEMPKDIPVLVRDHTFFGPKGEPVLVGTSIYRGDKFQFTYSFGTDGKR